MQTLLIIDDDKDLRQILKDNLEIENFIVFEAAIGKRMIEILKNHAIDCILLDLKLPDGDGLDFIQDIKKLTHAPLIIISGRQKKGLQAKGLNLGADDYLRKPFEMDELIARIHANLRLYKSINNNSQETKAENHSHFIGQWQIDYQNCQFVNNNNESAELSFQEYLLLYQLLENKGRIIKRDELCTLLKNGNYTPSPRAIDIKISRIRKKLGEDASLIKTIRYVGYTIV